jgi:uncharacterized SAM-binding protein YcdF (DUF218 family)
MFIIQKMMNFLIFPPAIFILIGFMGLIFIRKNFKKGFYILCFDFILIYLLSIEPIKNLILYPLESYSPPLNYNVKDKVSLVVVLGGGTVETSPEDQGSLHADSFKRAMYGLRIAKHYGIPLLYSGGRVFDSQRQDEALLAERLLNKYAMGVTIFTESQSRTTYENALYVQEKYRPERVILVTSAYHMKRAIYAFNKASISVVPAPTDYKIDSWNYNFTSFLPKSYEMDCIYKALKEYLGLLFYKIKD